MEQLALAQQIELLQQQQQQIAAQQQQYVNMGMMAPQQQMQNFSMQQQPQGNFQFPQQLPQQQLGVPMGGAAGQTHRRNQSALPGMASMGPPPAPSAGM